MADISQSDENILMASGRWIAPVRGQSHQEHIAETEAGMQSPDIPEQNRTLFIRHINEHQAMLQAETAPQPIEAPPGTGGGNGAGGTPDSTQEQIAAFTRKTGTSPVTAG